MIENLIVGSYSLSDHEKPLLSKVSDDESSSVDLRHQYESNQYESILTASSNELSYLTNERPPSYSVTENPRPESLMELKTLIEDVVRTDFNSYMFYETNLLKIDFLRIYYYKKYRY